MTPAEIEVLARRWFEQQMARAEQTHGEHWTAHREWVAAYVRTEVKEKLIARGWRAER